MHTQITVYCPRCKGHNIKKNGFDSNQKHRFQAALQRSEHEIKPTQKHYDVLQVNEFHTFVGYKKNKVWLIYAYHQKTGQIVAFVWGKRDLKTTFE